MPKEKKINTAAKTKKSELVKIKAGKNVKHLKEGEIYIVGKQLAEELVSMERATIVK